LELVPTFELADPDAVTWTGAKFVVHAASH